MTQYIDQISVPVENKPGCAARILKLLAESGINIRALSLSDATTRGILHMIVDRPQEAVSMLKESSFDASCVPVIGIYLHDEPGTLGKTMEVIGNAGYNVEYFYAFITRKPETAVVMLRVPSVDERLFTLLAAYGVETATMEELEQLA